MINFRLKKRGAMYKDKLSPKDVYSEMKFNTDFTALARTAKGETRGGTYINACMVSCTVLNRVRKQRGEVWGLTVYDVCHKANSKGVHQYSYWDKTKLKQLSYSYIAETAGHVMTTINNWKNGVDPTHGATHYHTHDILPDWAVGKTPCAKDDMHKFYNNIR